jgi:hypothetical protein
MTLKFSSGSSWTENRSTLQRGHRVLPAMSGI